MSILGRIFYAIEAFSCSLMIGGCQGQLFHSISHYGVNSPESMLLMSKIVSTAWKIVVISVFYQSLGFSKQDLEVMYCAAVKACPDIKCEGKDLFATFFLINKYREFGYKLHNISKAVKGKVGIEREEELIKQMKDEVQEFLSSIPA